MTEKEEKKKEPVAAAEEEPQVIEMKGGDYQIHIFLERGKNFKGDDAVESIDAMFQIETCGLTVYSKVEKGCPLRNEKGTHFGEHIFIEPHGLSHEYMKSANLEIKLMNKGVFRDEMIASFEIDIPKAYAMSDDHAIHNRWLAMNDPNSVNYQEIKAYIKCSISIKGPGDNAVKLQEDAVGIHDHLPALMPASIAKTYKQIKIGILTAKGIPDMDMALVSDITTNAYITTEWDEKPLKTEVYNKKKKEETCTFNEMFKFGILWPMTNSMMVIKAVDQDMIGDDTIGSIELDLKQVVKRYSTPEGKLVWKQLYGAPLGKKGSEVDIMNNNPSLGSNWMGKLLLYIQAEDAKYPELGKEPIAIDETNNHIKALMDEAKIFEKTKYEIQAEVCVGICLPNDKKFKVKIQVEGNSYITKDPKQTKNNYNRWSERIEQTFESEVNTITELGQVFIYLVDQNDNEVSFWKGNARDFEYFENEKEAQEAGGKYHNENGKWMWLPLSNNHAAGVLGEDGDHLAGMVQVKLSLRKFKEDNKKWKEIDAWRLRPQTRLKAFKVRCYIYQCKDLPILESDGSADPFIKLYNPEGEDFVTHTVPDSLNPIFYSTFDVNYECMSSETYETAPPIVLDVWDEDKELFDRTNDFMGRATIYLHECGAATKLNTLKKYLNRPSQPQWFPIRQSFDQTSPKIGEILCAFTIVDQDFAFETPSCHLKLSDFVPCKEINIDINFLGLREMESVGMFPVKKAYVRFNTKNMLPPDKAQVVTNIQTEPKAPGRNPNVLTMISFSCDLPEEKIYCPKLSCEVFDMVCKGWSQPKLGNFTIPVGDIRFEMQTERKKMKSMAHNCIDYLKLKFPNLNVSGMNQLSVSITPIDLQDTSQIDIEEVLRQQRNLDDTRLKAQMLDLYLNEGSGSGSQVIGGVGQSKSKTYLSKLDISRVSNIHKPMFESMEEMDIADEDLKTDRDILKSIREETKNEESKMSQSHYLGDAAMDTTQQDIMGQEIMTSRMNMDAPIIDLENGLQDIDERDDMYSVDLSQASQQRQRDMLAQRQSFAQGQMQQSIVVQMTKRSGQQTTEQQQQDEYGSELSFTSNTREMKANLLTHIKKCQDGVTQEDAQIEEAEIINYFKMSMFAKSDRKKNTGKKEFRESLKKIRERQIRFYSSQNNVINAKEVTEKLIQSEKPFLEHLQENIKVQSVLKKQKTKFKSARDEVKMQTEGKFETVLLPKYELNKRLGVYLEVDIPAESVYQGVGFDHPDTRQAIAEGKELPKRHYRRYYTDELENDKEIFTRKPFHRFDVVRAEAKKPNGLMALFGKKPKKKDPAFVAKPVGYFKGKVTVYCPIEQEKYNTKRTKLYNTLNTMVKKIHFQKFGKDLEFQLDSITTRESRDKLRQRLAEMEAYSEHLLDFFQETSYQAMLSSGMMNTKAMYIRLYLIEGRDFASRDIGGSSDPYMVITCGDKVYSEKDNYQIDEPNPLFNKCYEFSSNFPGAYPIEIYAYDYDDLFGDDLIGKTSIDLDDRQFCPEWKALVYKPIEEREIYHPSTCLSQGTIRCWVDIFDQSAETDPQNKIWDISGEPIQEYEVRLAVLDTKNVPCVDDEGVSDVFVRCWIGSTEKQETDTHWRCSTGVASFNWRMLFNIKSPETIYSSSTYNLTVQVYDRDILSGNDLICEYQLDLRLMMDDCRITQRLQHLCKKYYDDHFGENYGKNPRDPESESKDSGIEWDKDYPDSFWLVQKIEGQDDPVKIRLDIRMLPMHVSKGCKVGEGRTEPNNSPNLPGPVGRMEFSLNPFKMLAQLLGPGVMNKMIGVLCCAACCALILALLPLIMGNIASTLINKMIGLE